VSRTVTDVVERHRSSGGTFEAGGVRSFVLEQGDGPPVVCLHGVPASSFLYRKVLPELEARGLRGVAFDLPGLGLAERPSDFDYSWSGLARWTAQAIDALGIDRCHLVVHDIGGPIGFEWAIAHPERVLSLTVLDSPVDVSAFRQPWPMHPFSIRGAGKAWLALMRPPAFGWIFRHVGINDNTAVSDPEVDAYVALMKRGDGELLSRPVDQDRLGGCFLSLLAGSLDEFPVDEGRSGADQGDEVGGVDGAPAVLR
jgi:pimeloyl-ACP methyl ester carboxylesterase